MKRYVLIAVDALIVLGAVAFVSVWWNGKISHAGTGNPPVLATTASVGEALAAASSTTTFNSQASTTVSSVSSQNIHTKQQTAPEIKPKVNPVVAVQNPEQDTSKTSQNLSATTSQNNSTASLTIASTTSSSVTTLATSSTAELSLVASAPSVTVDSSMPIITATSTYITPGKNFLQLDLPSGYTITSISYEINTYDLNTTLGTLSIGQQLVNAQTTLESQQYVTSRFITGLNYIDFSASNFNYLGNFSLTIKSVEGTYNGRYIFYSGTPITTGWYQLEDY